MTIDEYYTHLVNIEMLLVGRVSSGMKRIKESLHDTKEYERLRENWLVLRLIRETVAALAHARGFSNQPISLELE